MLLSPYSEESPYSSEESAAVPYIAAGGALSLEGSSLKSMMTHDYSGVAIDVAIGRLTKLARYDGPFKDVVDTSIGTVTDKLMEVKDDCP